MTWGVNRNNDAMLDEVLMYANEQINGAAEYKTYSTDQKKLKAIFSSPALLKVICLQCDLFSIGKLYVYQNGKEIENDKFLDMIKKPNMFQHQSQYLWEVMFWNMLGNTYGYCESKFVTEDNRMFVLENHKMTFPEEMLVYKDKLVLSKKAEENINDFDIKYTYDDGSTEKIKWGYIIHTPDLSNGTGNWFKGQSRIDTLYKIISNSEAAYDAENINIRYTGKFLVAGQADPKRTEESQLPMTETEKNDIESKMNGRKQVFAIKSMVDIKRFVEQLANLKLDEIQLNKYYQIGTVYNIPKDVLEAFAEGGTYENQEKARGAFVSYCLQPKGNLYFESMAHFFGYNKVGKSIVIDWEHLPFMQVFAKERAETDKIKSETLLNLIDAGVVLEEINEMLDLKLTKLDYESIRQQRNAISQNAQKN